MAAKKSGGRRSTRRYRKKTVSAAGLPGRQTTKLASQRSRAVLLLIDVVNRFEFDGGEALLRAARPAARRIATLKKRAARVNMPVVYVNDNFGRWRSDFRALVAHCLAEGAPGRDIVRLLAPSARDYFVLKPSNSAFYASVLETLLRHLGADTLLLTGVATDNCVLFTAHDAYLRGFKLLVPRDCVAAETSVRNARALQIIARTMKADTRTSDRLRLASLMKSNGRR
jgi:nicotinamidase-related amidase